MSGFHYSEKSLKDFEKYHYANMFLAGLEPEEKKAPLKSGIQVSTINANYSPQQTSGSSVKTVGVETYPGTYEEIRIKFSYSPTESTAPKRTNVCKVYRVTVIGSEEAEIILNHPLELRIEKIDDKVSCYNELLNLSGSGESIEEALSNFADFFIFDYKTYKNSSPDDLSAGAKELLSIYKSIIRKEVWR
jgi:hypothetical protein